MITEQQTDAGVRRKAIARIREFNRFYTNIIGVLDRHWLKSAYSLSEGRVLYEIYHQPGCTAIAIKNILNMDEGYLSRMLNNFVKQGLVNKTRQQPDGRSFGLALSSEGEEVFLQLNNASESGIGQVTGHLSDEQLESVAANMAEIEGAISRREQRPVTLAGVNIRRALRPGDLGYIAYRHGRLYSEEYGIQCETYITEGLLEFYRRYDPDLDAVWICEHNGKIVGTLFLMHRENKAAQLRYFLIEPAYRGLGLGKKLLDEYMAFLKSHDYRSSYLWTIQELHPAAHLYKKLGFVLTAEKESRAFVKATIEQRYDLSLSYR